MEEKSLVNPKVLYVRPQVFSEPKRNASMTKLNLGLSEDKTKPREPLHLVINTGSKVRTKNLYQKQLKLLRRSLR